MQNLKLVGTLFSISYKLSSDQSSATEVEKANISQVPYSSMVESLRFAIVYTRPEIAQAMGAVSRYMANLGRDH